MFAGPLSVSNWQEGRELAMFRNMKPMPRLSVIEQTANHLRQGICEIRWGGRFPGVPAITRECEVSANVARAAWTWR